MLLKYPVEQATMSISDGTLEDNIVLQNVESHIIRHRF